MTALFFVNASSGTLPMPFMQALMAMDYTPVPLSGPPEVKVVDAGQRTLSAIDHLATSSSLSHDADFASAGATRRERRVGLLGFREFMSNQ